MKLVVFGATGGIGSQVVAQALEQGHMVTAVARRPSAITLRHARLTVVGGDVLDLASIQPALAGQDAVVSALGARDTGPTTVYSEGVANIMQAMHAASVRRILCISAEGLDPGPLLHRIAAQVFLWRAFKNSYTDLVRMEANVKDSRGLDWTIIRPPRLTDKPATGHYQIVVNRHLSHGSFISRADVAHYMLSHLADPATYCAWVEIAY